MARPARIPASGQEMRIAKWLPVVSGLLDLEAGSAERAQAIAWSARALGTSVRTVYRMLERSSAFGDHGLARALPKNAGQPRVVISRAADAAVGDSDVLAKLDETLDGILRELWKSPGSRLGGRKIAILAGVELRHRSEQFAGHLPPAAFKIPRKRAERYSHYRIVDIWKNDRKKFSDTAPRIHRTRQNMLPMELVVGDVKHFDVVVRRNDGTDAYPKMIAFEDAGTGRVFGYPILLAQGEGVRQEHVNEAFLAMASHARWGLCAQILLDRGSENGGLELLRGPMGELNRSSINVIIKSRPYTPQSKPIEGWFARFDNFAVNQIPGYLGPDRMRKKTQTQGQPPTPYGGTFEQFRSAIIELISTFNTWPVGGTRKGQSPETIFAAHLDTGWRPAMVDSTVLEAAFFKRATRTIDRGRIKIDGRLYTHPRIYGALRREVEVAMPWRRTDLPLFRFPEGEWIRAEIDPEFQFLDPEGAREGNRRRRVREREVRRLNRETPDFDVLQLVTKTRLSKIAPIPDHRGPRLDGGSDLREMADAIRADVYPEPSLIEARQAQRQADLQKIERRFGRINLGEVA